MRQIHMRTILFLAMLVTAVSTALAGSKPDFKNPNAVLADLRLRIDACSEAGARNCMVPCGYASKTLKNFLKLNPEGDPSIFRQRWQTCDDAYQNAGLPPVTRSVEQSPPRPSSKPSATVSAGSVGDRSRFVVAGLTLGGSMEAVRDRIFLLEAHGYFKKTKLEHSDVILSRGKSEPGPDIVRNYKGMIREKPVYIHFEATSDGRVYMIQYEQKESLDPDQIKAALIERYGKPTKRHGHYLSWGCDRGPQEGFCVKADASAHNMAIWAFDEDIKKAGYQAYEQAVLKEKGIKRGIKF